MERAIFSGVVDADGRILHESSRTPVAWWSFTKTLTAAIAIKLAGKQIIDLDEPLPHAPYTLRQLLSHTAGLPDYGALPAYKDAVLSSGTPWSVAELLKRTGSETLLFSPGEGWRYSNIGYVLALRRIETASTLKLAELLRRHVFDPLALEGPRLAKTPADMTGLGAPPPYPYDPGWAYPGTVMGPAGDAALCLHAILEGRILSDAELGEMLATRPIAAALPGRPWTATRYGLGIAAGTMELGGTPWEASGHGAAGPGSCGGVYRLESGNIRRTVAIFGDFRSEGDAERLALEMASR